MKANKNKRITKSKCRYYDVGNCEKYNRRCFDCKEYKTNKNYVDTMRNSKYYM